MGSEGQVGGKAPAAGFAPAGSAAGSGASPAERKVREVTWKNVEVGVHRCVECGGAVVSLVERDGNGRIVLRETVLLCPYCATLDDWGSAAKRVVREARTLAEARKLIAQLFDLEVPAPWEGAR